jgi:hypothetical protein
MWTAKSCRRSHIIVRKKFVNLDPSLYDFISRIMRNIYLVPSSAGTFEHSACIEIQAKFYLRNQPIRMCVLRCFRPSM